MKKPFNLVMFGALFVNLVYIIFGITLFQYPTISTTVIRVSFALLIIITSGYAFIKYLANNSKKSIYLVELIYGVVGILISLGLIFQPVMISNVVVLSLGGWLILSGLVKAFYAYKLINKKEEIASLIAAIAILPLIGGAAIIFYPQIILVNLSRGVALFLVMYALVDALQCLLFIKRSKELTKIFK